MYETKNTAQVIRKARVKKGITQAAIAKHLGFTSGQFVSNMERAIAPVPPKIYRRLIKMLDINSEEFMRARVKDYKLQIKAEVN